MTSPRESGKETRIAPRVSEMAPGVTFVEAGVDFSDGYRITIGWSEEDGSWLARASGLSCGDQIADGPTQLAAMLNLACSLSSCIDALNEDRSHD